MAILDWIGRRIFNTVHRNNLVYNTCWEDPRLDRVALELGGDDHVLVITSAGCNALDYALDSPAHVFAVDMNPRQNALLELKQAGIRNLQYDDFFRLFGEGRFPGIADVYQQKLRADLSDWSREFWDRKIKWFDNSRKTFYFRGTSGSVANALKIYTDRVIKVRPHLEKLMQAESLEEQEEIYEKHLKEKFWSGIVKFALNRDTTMSLLGVPKAQRRQIDTQYPGGLLQFLQDCLRGVFVKVPFRENYFWRVYINGCYSRSCCPGYLTESGFEQLRGGLVDRVSAHTNSVQGFLDSHDGKISRFILLDHMDWLSDHFFPLLEAEWQSIVNRAESNSRVLWRSGGLQTDFIDLVKVNHDGSRKKINSLLKYHRDLAGELHQKDRVHTYGSFYIADLSV